MAASLTFRRMALTSAGIGAAAGCMGTWFEMSHGVVCIPVLTLPPLMLSQQVAIGSTVLGVAARQVVGATLYALEPGTNASELDWEEIIDTKAAMLMAGASTVTALGTASLTARLPAKPLRRLNGVFLIAASLFMQWRDAYVRRSKAEATAKQPGEGQAVAEPLAAEPAEKVPGSVLPQSLRGLDGPAPGPTNDVTRLTGLAVLSGVVLGFFGIGPAWMLAPIISRTAGPGQLGELNRAEALVGPAASSAEAPAGGRRQEVGPLPAGAMDIASSGLSAFGSDERTRRTCALAMVPPSLAAAWRHYMLGHITNATRVALPLATGAIIGSAVTGSQLQDVPCDEDIRYGLAILLFMHGCWSFFKGV